MRICVLILLLTVDVSCSFSVRADDVARDEHAKAAESEAFPSIEKNGIVATLIEESVSRSPDGKHVATSFLFMVENRSKNPGPYIHRSPIRIFGNGGELYRDASNGSPKTATVTSEYSRRELPRFDELPEAVDPARTLLVRHWIHDELPDKAIAVEVGFGQNGKVQNFRFPIHPR